MAYLTRGFLFLIQWYQYWLYYLLFQIFTYLQQKVNMGFCLSSHTGINFQPQYENENENLDWHRREPIYPWHSFTFIGRKIFETHCAFPRERRLVGSDSKNDLESEMHMRGVQEIRQPFIPLLSFHPNPLHFFPLYFLSPFSFFPLYPSPSCFPFPSLFPQYHQKFSGAKWATGCRAFEMVLECSTVATGEQRMKSKELFSSTEKGRGLTFFSTCQGPAFIHKGCISQA